MNRKPIYALLGPTGGGKTELALLLDPDHNEVVSCDSRQVYRGLRLLSAMPSAEEQRQLRHHLIDFLAPDQSLDAARYVELADAAIADIQSRGKRAWLVGGAGFYFRALIGGLFQAETTEEARRKTSALNPEEQLQWLLRLDPRALADENQSAAGGKIHRNDQYRIGRALSLAFSGGALWSELWEEKRLQPQSRYDVIGYYVDWQLGQLTPRLRERAARMVAGGAAMEAQQVFELYGDCAALQMIGCPEALAAARGEVNAAQLGQALAQAHRKYAKAQITWFRRESRLRSATRDQLAELLQIRGGDLG
ncbi:MAG: tRNA (adenosine(37)-N6)-dimethylallyltransferase MiaA [Leptospirales bacterium]|nr:tRNA (adenosine(37)-N6)-dimethylallyltransferase MiaA [Leptospirales bacterium]